MFIKLQKIHRDLGPIKTIEHLESTAKTPLIVNIYKIVAIEGMFGGNFWHERPLDEMRAWPLITIIKLQDQDQAYHVAESIEEIETKIASASVEAVESVEETIEIPENFWENLEKCISNSLK